MEEKDIKEIKLDIDDIIELIKKGVDLPKDKDIQVTFTTSIKYGEDKDSDELSFDGITIKYEV